ncbi:ParB-like protein [Lichenihabitans psoromatis]|uniref:ParB-like protein n=1 Tax=Lichenihabitans psoromatis TaxID=2528642 RepID=UPI0010364460|nr:ParB-like protein [Lichenihabitans psoromatis]
MALHNPELNEVALIDLRPTQMTAGFAEVAQKRRAWKDGEDKKANFLPSHCFPAVRGPKDRIYITDHHHLGMALIEAGETKAFVTISNDFSKLARSEFWTIMDHLKLAHPYDQHGHRCSFDDMPKKLTALVDDPFRSLASTVKDAGGYAKATEPFAEFLWADFFRRRISAEALHDNKKKVQAEALAMAHTTAASHLPGWTGESST